MKIEGLAGLDGDTLVRQVRPAEFVDTVTPDGKTITEQLEPAYFQVTSRGGVPTWVWVAGGAGVLFLFLRSRRGRGRGR